MQPAPAGSRHANQAQETDEEDTNDDIKWY